MAILALKFDDRVLQEVSISTGTVTIGRQPDNVLQIDNPAVSGHHAKVYREGDHYVLEDCESFNGTYVDHVRISKVVLKDGDKALIGKHTIEFRDQAWQGRDVWQGAKAKVPQLDRTAFLDTAQAKELIAQAVAAASSGGAAAVQQKSVVPSQAPVPAAHATHQTVGTLTVIEGRTDQKHYVLTSQLTVIGKSKMAGIRLKRWFAPHVAASIYRSEDGYFIAPAGAKIQVKLNDVVVEGGKKQLEAGQVIEVAGIKLVFGFCEA